MFLIYGCPVYYGAELNLQGYPHRATFSKRMTPVKPSLKISLDTYNETDILNLPVAIGLKFCQIGVDFLISEKVR